MQSNTGRNDDYYANNVDYDIGHLISVSSYHVANSPWATSLNYYSRSITDNNRNTSPKNDSNVEQQKQNFLEVTPDAFRPVELPTTNAAMRTSSLTSLFASKNALSSSLKNSERRDRQYGNEDSIIAYPEIGHGIMSRTTSSARLEYFNNLNSGAHNDNYDDDEITNGHYGQYRTEGGHSSQRIDTDNSWSRSVDHRDADEVDYFVNSANVNNDHDSGLGIQIPSYQSKRIGWTAASTGEFQDIISVAKYHTDSSIKLTTSFEPVTKLGLERLRNASSPQLESKFNSQKMKSSSGTTEKHSSHSLRTTGEHSLPSSQINFDPRNRGTHPPLVSAMRKKNIVSSTETAVAR